MARSAEHEELMKKLGIPTNAKNVQFIDMGRGQPVRKTAGWTDEQIQGKTLEEIDQMISSARLAAESLRKTLSSQEEHIAKLQMVRVRRTELGD